MAPVSPLTMAAVCPASSNMDENSPPSISTASADHRVSTLAESPLSSDTSTLLPISEGVIAPPPTPAETPLPSGACTPHPSGTTEPPPTPAATPLPSSGTCTPALSSTTTLISSLASLEDHDLSQKITHNLGASKRRRKGYLGGSCEHERDMRLPCPPPENKYAPKFPGSRDLEYISQTRYVKRVVLPGTGKLGIRVCLFKQSEYPIYAVEDSMLFPMRKEDVPFAAEGLALEAYSPYRVRIFGRRNQLRQAGLQPDANASVDALGNFRAAEIIEGFFIAGRGYSLPAWCCATPTEEWLSAAWTDDVLTINLDEKSINLQKEPENTVRNIVCRSDSMMVHKPMGAMSRVLSSPPSARTEPVILGRSIVHRDGSWCQRFGKECAICGTNKQKFDGNGQRLPQ